MLSRLRGTMGNQLREQFIDSARCVHVFLKATGVFLTNQTDVKISQDVIRRRKILRCLWSWFWLLLNTQSGVYIFARRGFKHVYKLLFDSNALMGGMLTEQLNGALMRASAFIFETITHYLLVFSIKSTLKRFFATLEPIYCQLGSPNIKRIRIYSTACLFFTLWMVRFKV